MFRKRRKVMKMARAALISFGFLIILYSVFTAFKMKFNSGIVLTAISGTALLLFGIFYDTLSSLLWFDIVFFVSIGTVLLLISIIACYSLRDSDTGDEDAVIVLGSGLKGDIIGRQLKSRLDKAAEYCKKNASALIVVSGGQGSGETVTEAFAMERYLTGKGIDEQKIIKEDRSTSTYTNLEYTKKILDGRFAKRKYKAVIITSGYHIYRASVTAKKAGIDCTHLHSSIPVCQIPVSYARECAAIIKYLLFNR